MCRDSRFRNLVSGQPPQSLNYNRGVRAPTDVSRLTGLASRFAAFVAERHPLALPVAIDALETSRRGNKDEGAAAIEAMRAPFRRELARRLYQILVAPDGIDETTPGVTAVKRLEQARAEIVETCDGFLAREAIRASLTADERREILRGMVLTRAVDNRLKQLFMGGEVRWGERAFQGKGFRSLGQEAIYAGGIRLRRGPRFQKPDGTWNGDVLAPVIRDLGITLAMRNDEEAVRQVLSAQMGKAGPPMFGKDLHTGDWAWGVLPAAAPLAIGSLSIAGLAMGFWLEDSGRVAFSFIGEGGSSLGEWHEAINLCAVRKLPAVFCLQNNQTALSTPVPENSATRVFADKAAGYGIPGITDRRHRSGSGGRRIHLGSRPRACRRWSGAARAHCHAHVRTRASRRHALSRQGVTALLGLSAAARHRLRKSRAVRVLGQARSHCAVRRRRSKPKGSSSAAPSTTSSAGPRTSSDARRRRSSTRRGRSRTRRASACSRTKPRGRGSRSSIRRGAPTQPHEAALPDVEPGRPFDKKGSTLLEAVMLGVGDALRADPRVFVYGQDVGGQYGNAFLLLRPLLKEFGDRILNSPLAEGAVLGVCVGAALAGQRPIGEMQFNDFVATGFNQLVNNAAKIRYRWGGEVPMVVRMPWGGLRYAGPYHSQNTEPWFYRTPGLKIVVPSTPADARALMAAAVADPDPGALLRAHRALSRSDDQAGAAQPTRPPRCRSARPRFDAPAPTSR